jgi:hypothetical protein
VLVLEPQTFDLMRVFAAANFIYLVFRTLH